MTRGGKAALVAGVALGMGAAGWIFAGRGWWVEHRTPTFNRDIAPIVFEHCAACHRPGGMGPFSLLEYADVKKHARQIAEVTASRFMPPWLPAAGSGFLGERRLSEAQIRTFARWIEAGGLEGKAAHRPVAPQWPDGWQLGPPDLVVTMPEPYILAAEGRDIYRNFVAPIPLDRPRFVRAVEVQPGNPRAVHHAFLMLDAGGEARQLDKRDTALGFGGMNVGSGVGNPGGHFLSWQPGAMPLEGPAGTQWLLAPGTDAVFQLHMRPSGKEEAVQARVAFYFTDLPPTTSPFRLLLRSTAIDIPPGAEDYTIESSYQLPVDIEILAVLPHAHYLGRYLQGWAELPDGSRRAILSIPQWDFNWQGYYRFTRPLALPKGATLRMRYTYDNSAGNPVNEGQEPRRVQFGDETSDEMGELWLQVAAQNPADRGKLEADYVKNWAAPDTIARSRAVLARDPEDLHTRTNLGAVLAVTGKLDEAITELERALEIDPKFARAHAHLAQIHQQRGDRKRARAEFEAALALNPEDYKSRNNLGSLLLGEGDARGAAEHFERVLKAHPDEALVRQNLEKARAFLERPSRH